MKVRFWMEHNGGIQETVVDLEEGDDVWEALKYWVVENLRTGFEVCESCGADEVVGIEGAEESYWRNHQVKQKDSTSRPKT